MRIRVPGVITSRSPLGQNLALAVDAAITVSIEEESLEWEVVHDDPLLPHDQNNEIVAVAEASAPWLLPHRLHVTSTLPISQGLGSSNAAALAGILLANQLADLHLTTAEIQERAMRFEPYPAALAAAIHGGCQYRDPINGMITTHHLAPLQWFIYSPTQFVEASVPRKFPDQGVTPADYAALLAALEAGDDLWLRHHFPVESLRSQVTPEYFPQAEMINRAVLNCGGYGCFMAGNGPAIVCLAPVGDKQFETLLRHELTSGDLLALQLQDTGAIVA
ncbi:hypothetical protein ACFQ5J_08035 [Lacticaseibacillus baoqingensis]|uniref:GHMP kinase N-terminal domain-containing protein n=1 Tax=Lacticaseibacillus baoqingensis TaxID=2486013 RepID=A0ABW4E5J1_9LACO|nr:hypothetical protein [Lacticaseibacillus baoqingensis]